MSEKIIEAFAGAMRKAYGLGQTYWQQADSDYISQQKKSDVTAGRFIELNDQTCAELRAALATPPVASGALPETILPDEFWELVTDCSCTKDLGKSARLLNEWVCAYGQACAAAAAPNAALVEALKAVLSDFEGCYADGEPAIIAARTALAQAGAA